MIRSLADEHGRSIPKQEMCEAFYEYFTVFFRRVGSWTIDCALRKVDQTITLMNTELTTISIWWRSSERSDWSPLSVTGSVLYLATSNLLPGWTVSSRSRSQSSVQFSKVSSVPTSACIRSWDWSFGWGWGICVICRALHLLPENHCHGFHKCHGRWCTNPRWGWDIFKSSWMVNRCGTAH